MLLAVRRLCKPALLKSLKMFDPVAHPYNTYSLSSSQRMDCYSIIEQMGGLDAYDRQMRLPHTANLPECQQFDPYAQLR